MFFVQVITWQVNSSLASDENMRLWIESYVVQFVANLAPSSYRRQNQYQFIIGSTQENNVSNKK